jgi:hypothetical protein
MLFWMLMKGISLILIAKENSGIREFPGYWDSKNNTLVYLCFMSFVFELGNTIFILQELFFVIAQFLMVS